MCLCSRVCLYPFLVLLALPGCRSYRAARIDWPQELAEWSDTSAARAPLTLEEARQCALILNPGINALRLARQTTERRALAAGWWEDPSFNIDAARVLRGGAHPWILGSGLSFTLPLNGVPGLEKRAAQAYVRADALAVTLAERELLAEVDRCWTACQIDLRCAAAQQAYKKRLQDRERSVLALIAMGELPKAEGDRIAQELIRLDLDCACCGAETVARKQAFLRLLGLYPSAPLVLAEEKGVPTGFGEPPASDLDLVRHPRVQEKLARFEASEEELRAALRKQYPDLVLGPLYENEEGGGRLGASLGLNLPLWNRNRKGIAEAEGGRAAARLAAAHEWRGLVAEWREAQRLLEVAQAKEQRIRETLLPEAQRAAERTERLFKQGEADVLAILAADAAVYSVQEGLLEATRSLSEARIRLNLLQIPTCPVSNSAK
jgi:outer membrane protein, heavy metal efflux system